VELVLHVYGDTELYTHGNARGNADGQPAENGVIQTDGNANRQRLYDAGDYGGVIALSVGDGAGRGAGVPGAVDSHPAGNRFVCP